MNHIVANFKKLIIENLQVSQKFIGMDIDNRTVAEAWPNIFRAKGNE